MCTCTHVSVERRQTSATSLPPQDQARRSDEALKCTLTSCGPAAKFSPSRDVGRTARLSLTTIPTTRHAATAANVSARPAWVARTPLIRRAKCRFFPDPKSHTAVSVRKTASSFSLCLAVQAVCSTGGGMATSGGQGAVDAAEAPLAGGKQGGGGGGGIEGGHAGAAGGKVAKTAESLDEFTKRSFTATQKILREQRCALKSHASPWLCAQ